jgi:pimeloyl-ACP methyl ester carboxylesterase
VELAATGVRMQYVEVGDKAGAETVIMLHGYTQTSRAFFPTIEALTALDPDLHIYALDLRGHGGSSLQDDPSCPTNPKACFELSDFADDVFAFMDTKGITSAHLVGHSLGSMVAQEIATTIPGAVKSLVLISSAGNTIDNPFFKDFVLTDTIEGMWRVALESDPGFGDWPQAAYELTARDADPNVEAWITQSWIKDPTANADFLAKIVPETADIPLGTWLGTVQMLLEAYNIARLEALAVDSLIIWAKQDITFPEDPDQIALRAALDVAAENCLSGYIWKEYGKLAPTTPGVQDSDLGHNVLWAAPAQVAADVHAFITTGEPTEDLYFANPLALTEIQTEAGEATLIQKPAATNCDP